MMKEKPLQSQLIEDARAALRYYGETLSIRRPGLVQKAQVRRVRVIYEDGRLKPQDLDALERSVMKAESEVAGVEVQFQ